MPFWTIPCGAFMIRQKIFNLLTYLLYILAADGVRYVLYHLLRHLVWVNEDPVDWQVNSLRLSLGLPPTPIIM